VVLVNLWIPSPPTRAPKHTLSQLPLLLLLPPPANAHSIRSSNSAAHVVKGDENTEKERGEKNTQKTEKTNKPREEATVTNQWERCSSEIHEIHYNKFLHFSHTQKSIISPKNN